MIALQEKLHKQAGQPQGWSACSLHAALLIALFTLKLSGVIDWPWWAVSMPLWLPLLPTLAVATLTCTLAMLGFAFILAERILDSIRK